MNRKYKSIRKAINRLRKRKPQPKRNSFDDENELMIYRPRQRDEGKVMQSRLVSWVEVIVSTLSTGGAAALANYFVLPLWGLHPSAADSVGMAVFFGVLSVVVKYPIRRGFNAIR